MRVFAYRRFSPRPLLKHSMDIQKSTIESWARAGGHQIVGWFDDQGVSGDTSGRAGRDALIARAKAQDAEGIIVSDLSRWTREDAMAAFALLNELRTAGLEVRTVAEHWLDLNQPFAFTVLAAMLERNHQELKTIRDKTKSGLLAAQGQGTWIGRVPWGWERVRELRQDKGVRIPGKDYWIRPAKEALLREIFEKRASGRSWHGIERDTGIRAESVREILTNEINRKVVGDELFDRAQRQGPQQRGDERRAYLLTGLLICPWCGHRLIGNALKGWGGDDLKSAHYRCKVWAAPHPQPPPKSPANLANKVAQCRSARRAPRSGWRTVSERLVVRHLIAAVERVRLDDTTRAAVIADFRNAAPGIAGLVQARQNAIADIERRRANIERGVEEGTIRPESARERIAELIERENNLPPPLVEAVSAEADLSLLESLPAIIARARANWPNEKEVTRAANALLREVIEHIEWPERTAKYRPRVVFAARYAAIISAVSGASPGVSGTDAGAAAAVSAAATADRNRASSPQSGEAATLE